MSFEVKDPLDTDLTALFNAGVGQSLEMNLQYATLAVALQNGRGIQQVITLLKALLAALPGANAPATPAQAVTLAPPA